MRFFFDTEFMETPGSIVLLSIGIIAEDGRRFYAEVADADHSLANDWVKENVLPHLLGHDTAAWIALHLQGVSAANVPLAVLGEMIQDFVGDHIPEFWANWCAYDWVVFCWTFGAMVDLPEGWPMFCNDLQQECLRLGVPNEGLPVQARGHHNALKDAEHAKAVYDWLVIEDEMQKERG